MNKTSSPGQFMDINTWVFTYAPECADVETEFEDDFEEDEEE